MQNLLSEVSSHQVFLSLANWCLLSGYCYYVQHIKCTNCTCVLYKCYLYEHTTHIHTHTYTCAHTNTHCDENTVISYQVVEVTTHQKYPINILSYPNSLVSMKMSSLMGYRLYTMDDGHIGHPTKLYIWYNMKHEQYNLWHSNFHVAMCGNVICLQICWFASVSLYLAVMSVTWSYIFPTNFSRNTSQWMSVLYR